MLFHEMTEWRASVCSADNDNGGFGGDTFGGGADFGGGQFGSAGGGNSIEGQGGVSDSSGGGIGAGSGDFGLGGPGPPRQRTSARYRRLRRRGYSPAMA